MLRRTPSLWATKVSLKRSTEMEDSENWKLRGAINYPSKLLQLPVRAKLFNNTIELKAKYIKPGSCR